MSSTVENLTPEFDPITIEIVQNSLTAITDEMFATMRRTAMSSIIYEVLDFGVALFNADGELASSGSGIPGFIGMLEPGVAAIREKFGADDIHDGDVFMLNIPHKGGVSHVNDVVLIIPVFYGKNLIGWLSNKAHWVDLGGAFPGGISPDATEIYQEGLQLPGIKVFERSQLNQAVLDIIMTNSRLPETTEGDFWAGIASMRAGQKRFLSLVEKYGEAAVRFAMSDYIALGEKIARQGMKDLPKGDFFAEETLEDGRLIKVKVSITDDRFLVDFRGNPEQSKSSSLNASWDSTFVDCQMIFKAITSPETFGNAGSFRPVEMLVDEGSMFAASYPAAMGVYYEVAMLTFDLLWKALAPALPGRLTAGHYSSICGTFMGGPHPETGHTHGIVEPQLGGWGAAEDSDGINALYTGFHGDTFNVPVEITEQRNGLMVDRLALNDAPGGEGEFIGGKGIVLDYRIMADDWWITMAYVRSEVGPWGLDGGLEGSTNYIEIVRADGETTRYAACTAVPLGQDDVIKVYTANGGGYGDPKDRPQDKIGDDMRNGFITPARAKEVYGFGT